MSLGSIVGDSLDCNRVGDLLGMVVVCNVVGLGDGRTSIVPIEKLISLSSMSINISTVLGGGKKSVTVCGHCVTQLQSLRAKIEQTSPHYI